MKIGGRISYWKTEDIKASVLTHVGASCFNSMARKALVSSRLHVAKSCGNEKSSQFLYPEATSLHVNEERNSAWSEDGYLPYISWEALSQKANSSSHLQDSGSCEWTCLDSKSKLLRWDTLQALASKLGWREYF